MNRLLKPAAALAIAASVAACQQQSSDAEAPSAAAPAEVALDTPNSRLSYGLAISMMRDGVEIDIDAFAMGVRDAAAGGEMRMTGDEIRAEMSAFQQRVARERQAEREALAAANLEAGQAFLAENGAREGVVTTESGLQYEVLEAGDGAKPTAADQVRVHYRGTLLDGTVFDSSYERGEPVSFGLAQVIPGWTEGLQLMNVGSKYRLYIPSELAYGAAGSRGAIGPNAALIFDVELLGIPSQTAEAPESESGEG